VGGRWSIEEQYIKVKGSWIVNEKASKENFCGGPKQFACVAADLCVGYVCGPAKSLHIVWLT
jgi:hypothetical protein